MKPEDTAVLDQIRTAFPPAPIVGTGAFAPWGNGYLDAAPYAEQLDGKTWDELDHAYLVRRSDALGFLGTDHLVAVLPVYLSALVRDGVWSPAAGMLTIILTKPEPRANAGLGGERFTEFVEKLTPDQHGAVSAALRALAAQDEGGDLGAAASAALESYWVQHVDEGS